MVRYALVADGRFFYLLVSLLSRIALFVLYEVRYACRMNMASCVGIKGGKGSDRFFAANERTCVDLGCFGTTNHDGRGTAMG